MKPESYRCKSPLAFIVFNRVEPAQRVFAEIAKARPSHLLVIADGPRADHSDDAKLCSQVRSIVDRIDWDCKLSTNFSDSNLGCAARVSSGIDWVFENVEEAIFLEDDCLPDPSFFRYCDDLLESYRNDPRIMSISGDNFQFGRKRSEYSYYFSRFAHIWGWATWRRAWKHYDIRMSQWPLIRDGGWLNDILDDRSEAEYWTEVFERAYQGKTGTWDYQWMFACWLQSGLTILPNVNLISNIGFGVNATHTVTAGRVAEMATESLSFPLAHPPIMVRDARADKQATRLFFQKSRLSKARTFVKTRLG
jgi:hypothetical protein